MPKWLLWIVHFIDAKSNAECWSTDRRPAGGHWWWMHTTPPVELPRNGSPDHCQLFFCFPIRASHCHGWCAIFSSDWVQWLTKCSSKPAKLLLGPSLQVKMPLWHIMTLIESNCEFFRLPFWTYSNFKLQTMNLPSKHRFKHQVRIGSRKSAKRSSGSGVTITSTVLLCKQMDQLNDLFPVAQLWTGIIGLGFGLRTESLPTPPLVVESNCKKLQVKMPSGTLWPCQGQDIELWVQVSSQGFPFYSLKVPANYWSAQWLVSW